MEGDFCRWMFVSGKGCKIEGRSFLFVLFWTLRAEKDFWCPTVQNSQQQLLHCRIGAGSYLLLLLLLLLSAPLLLPALHSGWLWDELCEASWLLLALVHRCPAAWDRLQGVFWGLGFQWPPGLARSKDCLYGQLVFMVCRVGFVVGC